jgi:hypothetical protein
MHHVVFHVISYRTAEIEAAGTISAMLSLRPELTAGFMILIPYP